MWVSAGGYASENGAVQYYSEDYYLRNVCSKEKNGVYLVKSSTDFTWWTGDAFSKCSTIKLMLTPTSILGRLLHTCSVQNKEDFCIVVKRKRSK